MPNATPDRDLQQATAGPEVVGDDVGDLAGELLELLLQALKELGDAGQADRANRLAAAAYVRLRRQDPKQAQRINVLMHRLVARMAKSGGAGSV